MSQPMTRRSFSAGLAFSIPAALFGSFALSRQAANGHDPNGTAMDLESIFLRISPFDLRDMLMASPFQAMEQLEPRRWEDISQGPYFSSVGGVNILPAGGDEGSAIGAYGIYLAPAGARAGQYLGRRALESSTTEVVASDVAGYAAEVLVYNDGNGRELTQVPVGNVMVLGYDTDVPDQANGAEHPSTDNAGLLITHLRQLFEITR